MLCTYTEIPTIIHPSATKNDPRATGSIIVGISVCTNTLCVYVSVYILSFVACIINPSPTNNYPGATGLIIVGISVSMQQAAFINISTCALTYE